MLQAEEEKENDSLGHGEGNQSPGMAAGSVEDPDPVNGERNVAVPYPIPMIPRKEYNGRIMNAELSFSIFWFLGFCFSSIEPFRLDRSSKAFPHPRFGLLLNLPLSTSNNPCKTSSLIHNERRFPSGDRFPTFAIPALREESIGTPGCGFSCPVHGRPTIGSCPPRYRVFVLTPKPGSIRGNLESCSLKHLPQRSKEKELG